MQWLAQAPANIALIKYMGKKDENSNLPSNSSLSYSLDKLISTVTLEQLPAQKDTWEPLILPGTNEFHLSLDGQRRFIAHFQNLKAYFNYSGGFLIRSNNNFPQGSGLASSASSFAALTKCAVMALSELTQVAPLSVDEQAKLSRLGSGSSCRSFYSPWALWKGEEVQGIDLPYSQLIHQVIVINAQEKTISSSEAHRRVKTSPLFDMRTERAENNLKLLLNAMAAKDWKSMFQICWTEFQDMHHLFSTSIQPFSYLLPESLHMLSILEDLWEKQGDGPLVTMDAGPNIHLLYRVDQDKLARQFKADYLVGNYDVF